jgi:hypothetical protein
MVIENNEVVRTKRFYENTNKIVYSFQFNYNEFMINNNYFDYYFKYTI